MEVILPAVSIGIYWILITSTPPEKTLITLEYSALFDGYDIWSEVINIFQILNEVNNCFLQIFIKSRIHLCWTFIQVILQTFTLVKLN